MADMDCDILTYVEKNCAESFNERPFGEADALALPVLSYLDIPGLDLTAMAPVADVAERVSMLPDSALPQGRQREWMGKVARLLSEAALAPRCADVSLRDFKAYCDTESETQFAALSFILPDNTMFLSFRGADDSLIGWKEDFNMCFTEEIPSRLMALEYTSSQIESRGLPARLGGHSKGGNLAVWAAAKLPHDMKTMVKGVLANDSPVFSPGFLSSEGYLEIRDPVRSFVPEESIVGLLMADGGHETIRATRGPIVQHDPFCWVIRDDGSFERRGKGKSRRSRRIAAALNAWLRSMDESERKEVVDVLWELAQSSNQTTVDGLFRHLLGPVGAAGRHFRSMGWERRHKFLVSVAKLPQGTRGAS